MDAWLAALVAWIGLHPVAAGLVIFAVAFCDALVVVGIVVPALPVLFGVGAMIGLDLISPLYAFSTAAAGAFAGDGLSYWFGHHYGARMQQKWPFSRYPSLLAQSAGFFRRHGIKGIFIARFVGAIRPFVPAASGMLGVKARIYLPASAVACVAWSIAFISPGILFGASLDLASAVAGRLAQLLGLLLVSLWLTAWLVYRLHELTVARAARWLERSLAWSHRHPLLGRYTEALMDPTRPESGSLALLALLLLIAGWAFFALLIAVPGAGGALPLDIWVHEQMFALRTPWADRVMATFSAFGDWQTLLPAATVVFLWLLWRTRWSAALHWAAALVVGLALILALGAILDMPEPPAGLHARGFAFPATHVAMSTVVFGFFAVLVGRELPGRRRAWPYLVGGLLVAAIAFARLYFGASWLSDIAGGITLGLAWIALVGIAYRRRASRSFWVRPIALLFFATLFGVGLWHGARSCDATLALFEVPRTERNMARTEWWNSGWRSLASARNDLNSAEQQPFNVQYAGDLAALRTQLLARGWREPPSHGVRAVLLALKSEPDANTVPILPAAHNGLAEALILTRSDGADDRQLGLRLWPSDLRLGSGATPVWQGIVAEHHLRQRWYFFSLWEFDPPYDAALAELVADLDGLDRVDRQRSTTQGLTLLAAPINE